MKMKADMPGNRTIGVWIHAGVLASFPSSYEWRKGFACATIKHRTLHGWRWLGLLRYPCISIGLALGSKVGLRLSGF